GCTLLNHCPTSATVGGSAANFTGPAGAVYTIVDGVADYGTINLGATRNCSVTGNCYRLEVSAGDGRPAAHWDATVTETTSGSGSSPTGWILPMGSSPLEPETCPVLYGSTTWTLHIGKSFSDVSSADSFYPSIENLFHHRITSGCGAGQYCPDSSIRRDQMAVFLLKSMHGAEYAPPTCSGAFADVPCPGPFTDWVEQIHTEGIIEDCGGGNFCPAAPVTRRHMSVWLLKASVGSGYTPPAATGLFADVPVGDVDAAWIEDLYRRQITAGCSASPLLYCPDRSNTRAQMAVFIVKAWGLRLY
ncbi:MAG: S-layer homology domain-containing protein, partial [Thermoanaerobaculia bacterium]